MLALPNLDGLPSTIKAADARAALSECTKTSSCESSTPDAPRFECPHCRRTYLRPFPGPACWECQDKARRTARQRAEWLRESGISERHAALRTFDELDGPEPYLRAVASVCTFTQKGNTVLALLGRRGAGKSQLAAIAVRSCIDSGHPARMVSVLRLLGDLKRRFGDGGDAEGEWLREWSQPHLLVVDEIGELVAGDHSRAMLTMLLDERYQRCKPTILIGNLDLRQFADAVGASVADRATEGMGGVVLCNDWPSFRGAQNG